LSHPTLFDTAPEKELLTVAEILRSNSPSTICGELLTIFAPEVVNDIFAVELKFIWPLKSAGNLSLSSLLL
jgi:hypothetical protein